MSVEQASLELWSNETAEEPYKDPEWLREKYWGEGISMERLASMFDMDPSSIRYWFEKYGIERRDPDPPTGTGRDSPRWKEYASFSTRWTGYECWQHNFNGEKKVVSVHRLVAVAEYGLGEVKGVHIHHKNGIPWDNRPENLEPVDPVAHGGRH